MILFKFSKRSISFLLVLAIVFAGFATLLANKTYASTNLAIGASASSSSSFECCDWGVAKINDGQQSTVSGSNGWSSNNTVTVNHTEWVQLDLGASQSIGQVKLFPRSDGINAGYGFPVDFTIQVSTDGTTWTTVTTQTGFAKPASGPTFSFTSTSARYVKVNGTSLRANPNESNYYRMQFAEVEIYDSPTPSNLATGASASSSSSFECCDWGLAKINDGQQSTVSGSNGWSSNNTVTVNHTEWVQLDLGASQSIGQVKLFPRNDGINAGYGFPIDFTIQVSTDGTTWSTVATQTSYAKPASGQSFSFTSTSARYVKVNGTSLRANPNESNYYRMQFAEMEIYNSGTAPTPTPTPIGGSMVYFDAIQTYGNFETAGIDLKFKSLITNQSGNVYYKKTTDSTYMQGQPFVKYDGNHMATSLFDLAANTTYDVKIVMGGSSGTSTDYTTVTTKPAYSLPAVKPGHIVNVANQTQLNAAIAASVPGDHILLDPNGAYTGFEFRNLSGTAADPILIGSQTSQKPVFSGGGSLYHSNYIIVTSLELAAIDIRGSSYDVIYNNYVHDGDPNPADYASEIQIEHSDESSMPGVGGHLIMNNIVGDNVHDAVDESQGPAQSFGSVNGRTYTGIKGIYSPGAFNTIRGNTVYGVMDGISPTGDEGQDPVYGPDEPDILLVHPNQNMDVYDNVIYDTADDGIETDGIVVNARIFRNQIGRNINAISIAPTYPGPIYIVRNTATGSLENNMKMNTSVAGVVRNVFIFNNTFVQKTAENGSRGVIYQGEPALTQDIVFKNNIFSALTRVINGDMYSGGNYHKRHIFDYNLGYSTLTSGTLYKWSTETTDPLNNSFYTSLAAFTSGTGQEVHGVWGNPLLNLNPLASYPSISWLRDVHLNSSSSPAINAGVVIPGITNGFNGTAPDMGAFEY